MKTNIKLNKNEFNRMSFLLGKSKHLILTLDEQTELRTLISKEQDCPANFDKMIETGLIIVGMYYIMEEYNKMKE